VSFFSSSIGTKILIALTGLALFAFLVVHLAGNLLAFAGPEAFNEYSHKLVSNPLVYVAEAGLAVLFVLHVFKTSLNWAANRAARPVGYERRRWAGRTSRKSLASTSMIVTGAVTFVFVILHLKTFKFGPWYLVGGSDVRDLYRLLIEVFQDPITVVFYVVAMALIGLHLRHGLSSALQSLGIEHPRYARLILNVGTAVAILIGVGFALIPVWAYVVGGRS